MISKILTTAQLQTCLWSPHRESFLTSPKVLVLNAKLFCPSFSDCFDQFRLFFRSEKETLFSLWPLTKRVGLSPGPLKTCTLEFLDRREKSSSHLRKSTLHKETGKYSLRWWCVTQNRHAFTSLIDTFSPSLQIAVDTISAKDTNNCNIVSNRVNVLLMKADKVKNGMAFAIWVKEKRNKTSLLRIWWSPIANASFKNCKMPCTQKTSDIHPHKKFW